MSFTEDKMKDKMKDKKKICIKCKDFKDAGPVSAHLAGIEGTCLVDGHSIGGALQECDVNEHNEMNKRLNDEIPNKDKDTTNNTVWHNSENDNPTDEKYKLVYTSNHTYDLAFYYFGAWHYTKFDTVDVEYWMDIPELSIN